MSKVKFLEGTVKFEVNGIPNRDGGGALTHSRLQLLKQTGEMDLHRKSDGSLPDNHVRAKVDSDGKSFTSSECINQAMMSPFIPKINTSEVIDDAKLCASLFHLVAGNVRTAGGLKKDSYQRSKSLKLSNAVDEEAGKVFIEFKSNNTVDIKDNGMRTQETAPKRIQVSDYMLDLQNLSIFIFEEGDPSVKHCSTDPEKLEKTLEFMRKLMKDLGVEDVSNIRNDKRVKLKTAINEVSFKGFVFTKEQVLVLAQKAISLLRATRKVTTHGSFKVTELTMMDQEGNAVQLGQLTAEDIELDYEMIDQAASVQQSKKTKKAA